MKEGVIMFVEVVVDGDPQRRISIPVDLDRIDDTFCLRVAQMNSNGVTMWCWGGLAGEKYKQQALAREAELLSNKQIEFHPPMSHDDDGVHREVKY